MKILTVLILPMLLCLFVFAQAETLTNSEIIMMTQAGLSRELIVRKIKDSKCNFQTTAQDLIELKKAGVLNEIIEVMFDKKDTSEAGVEISENKFLLQTKRTEAKTETQYIVLEPKEALQQAKTIAIEKSSLNPSRQALEKELLKRQDWRQLNLNIVRYKQGADLYIEIGFVPFSILTHRYVFCIYDNKSGTVIAAGETTSWGSLAANLARHISKKLDVVLQSKNNSFDHQDGSCIITQFYGAV